MNGRTQILVWVMVALFLTGCGSYADMAVEERPVAMPAGEAGFAFDSAPGLVSADADYSSQFQQMQFQERLIIRTGNMSIVVSNTEDAMLTLTSMVNERGGWVVNSSLFQSGRARAGNMTVRVPAAEFDGMMAAVRDLAIEVTRETAEGQDVTEEFVDLSARLENLQATANRVRGFLDDAQTVEDALNVNRELSRLEGEIEAMTGRLQYLSQSAAYSTLTINLTPDPLAQPIEVTGWQPQGVARNAIEALVAALQGLATLLIYLGLLLVPLALVIFLPLGGIAWFGWRKWRR